ncbi:metallophosphoesterase family protein [Miltoncostaea oceani]|uniref:metallophosphoesterase family protein n=1 Tax=Miltoncostaea oceani TaxID=2843216 RepID=UPI001C3DCFF9|nr:metallophosphoesterase family protein [Miltoncostaea oceani]
MAHDDKIRDEGREPEVHIPGPSGPPPRALNGLADFWLISDTHFGHRNIIRYAGRPEDHERRMITAWRERVADDDVILHLGDLAMMKREPLTRLMEGLSGRILMLEGNHDRGSKTMYRELGIELITRSFLLEIGGWGVWFSHRPEPARIHGNRQVNVHGHIHEKVMGDPRCLNASVEQIDYGPVRVAGFLEAGLESLSPARR